MSIRLNTIMQPIMARPIPGDNDPFSLLMEGMDTGRINSVHEGARGATIAQRGEAIETHRLVTRTWEQIREIQPTISQIIDTTKRYADEQARDVKGTRGIFNGATVVALTLFGYTSACPLLSAKCASGLVEDGLVTDESAIVPLSLLMATAGVVTATGLQVIKNVLYPDHQAEDRATLTRLWTELDGVVPANLITAGNKLKSRLMAYTLVLALTGARTAPQDSF
ncbi:MAG: hypothetical protein NTX49_01145 [Chlamydiae bacterium]|nr:hypothetical protein [Chlamydiota bacterium]